MTGKIYIANWKMNLDVPAAIKLAQEFVQSGLGQSAVQANSQAWVAVSNLSASAVMQAFNGSGIKVIAQDCSTIENNGAFTGETNAAQLVQVGMQGTLVGHSERRQFFGETDEMIAKKVVNAINSNLKTVLCIGETSEERAAGKTAEIINTQLEKDLADLTPAQVSQNIIIGYEPVWAISTFPNAKPAEPADVEEAHDLVRSWLVAKYGEEIGSKIPVLYGGSAKPENAASLINIPNVDGFIVGGASLDAQKFKAVVEA